RQLAATSVNPTRHLNELPVWVNNGCGGADGPLRHRVDDRAAEAGRSGGDTGGPLRSVQFIAKMSPSSCQPTSTRPASTDSSPYLPALVASSCSARPIA